MSITVLISTGLFVIMTLPSAIAGGYYLTELLQTDSGKVILFICDNILFTYHSINLIILMISNKQFWRECKIMVTKKNQVESMTTTM